MNPGFQRGKNSDNFKNYNKTYISNLRNCIDYFVSPKISLFEMVEQKSYAGRSERFRRELESLNQKRVVLGCERPDLFRSFTFSTSGIIFSISGIHFFNLRDQIFSTSGVFIFFKKYFLFLKMLFLCFILINRHR